MHEAVIVSAVRSGVAKGKADGSLANVHPVDLAADVIKGAVDAAGLQPKDVCDVMLGCASPEGAQGANIARLAVLRAGFPVEVAGTTINRFCSSGLQTIAMAAASIMTGMADTVVAGGIDMMSRIPMGGHHKELHPEMTEAYIGMGFTAENVAERWGVNREDQDAWALRSHQRAAAALAAGRFDDEIVPIRVGGGEPFRRDELVRADTSLEKLSTLRPAFKTTGTVTAGNASPYSDGAGALVLTSREKAEAMGLPILARFVGYGTSGVAPEIMGIAPALAVPNALRRTKMEMGDIDLFEFNEAFAAQVLAVMREIDMPEERTNVNGGAIALGHPLGATGSKLSAQLIHELKRRGGGMGMVTMCVGGGMGAAGIFEVYG